jgi:hypothetical protein
MGMVCKGTGPEDCFSRGPFFLFFFSLLSSELPEALFIEYILSLPILYGNLSEKFTGKWDVDCLLIFCFFWELTWLGILFARFAVPKPAKSLVYFSPVAAPRGMVMVRGDAPFFHQPEPFDSPDKLSRQALPPRVLGRCPEYMSQIMPHRNHYK